MFNWKKSFIITSLTVIVTLLPLLTLAQEPEIVNEAVVNLFVEEFFNNQNTDIAYELLTPDFVAHDPLSGDMNRDEFVEFFETLFESQPDIVMPEYTLIAGEGLVAQELSVEELMTTRIENVSDYDGIVSDYGAYIAIFNFFSIEDELIDEAWWIYDNLQLMHFIGMPRSIPDPDAPAGFYDY